MIAYTIRRVLLIFPLLFAVATVTFFLMHSVEGGPFDGDKPLTEATRQRLNEKYNLDGSLLDQYTRFLGHTARLDLGVSTSSSDRPVRDIIQEKFGVSLQLGICAFVFAVLLGSTLGVISAINQNGISDYVGVFVATGGAALPSFILAPLLVILFALKLDWFDVLGWDMWNYKKMVLPMVALGMLPGAFIARIVRASMLDILRQDYIRTARAKGVKETTVILRHAVKNGMIPVLTVLGGLFGRRYRKDVAAVWRPLRDAGT